MANVVEIMDANGAWVQINGATVAPKGKNHVEVVFSLPGFNVWMRVSHFDGHPMMVDGALARQVFGSNVTHGASSTFTLQVLL